MRIRHKIILNIADDTDMKNILFKTDETLSEVIVDSLEQVTSGIVKTLATETDTLTLGDLTPALGLYLRVDKACTLLINGDITLPLVKTDEAAEFIKLYLPISITSIALTAGEDNVKGVWCVWGVPTEDE